MNSRIKITPTGNSNTVTIDGMFFMDVKGSIKHAEKETLKELEKLRQEQN